MQHNSNLQTHHWSHQEERHQGQEVTTFHCSESGSQSLYWGGVLEHVPDRHTLENVLGDMPEYVIKHLPKHVLRHMSDKHMLEHVSRNVPKRMTHAVLMT